MTKTRLFLLVIVTVILTSCAVTKPILATENPIGSKIGRSKQTGILFFPPPDCDTISANALLMLGGITSSNMAVNGEIINS